MVVQPLLRVVEVLAHVLKLPGNIRHMRHAVELRLVRHVERLRHVQPIQPNLVRIQLLMPEIAALAARMLPKPLHVELNRLAIALLARLLQGEEQRLAAVDGINVVLPHLIIRNAAVRRDIRRDVIQHEIAIQHVPRRMVEVDAPLQHAAILIVPILLIGCVICQKALKILLNIHCHAPFCGYFRFII